MDGKTIYFLILLSVVTLCCISEGCPCAYNASSQTADCSCTNCYLTSPWTMLKKIPDCVPDTTRVLDLSGNNITYHPGRLQRFTALMYLDLSENIRYTPGNDSFSGLPHLQSLYLNGTYFYGCRCMLFTEPTNLQTLSLQKVVLISLPHGFFSNLDNLTYLDLSHTSLTDLSNAFIMLPYLIHLKLRGNEINLDKQIFAGLSYLQILDLSDCFLITLTKDIFEDLVNLTYLDLSANHLTEIPINEFASIHNLLHLNLSSNVGLYDRWDMNLSSQSLAGLSNLKFLSLNKNMIRNFTSFPVDVFEPLDNLEELHLVGFCSQEDYYYHCEDIDEHLSRLPSLKKLHIDNFVISSLGPGFLSLKNLELLYFSDLLSGNYQMKILSNKPFLNLTNSSLTTLIINGLEIRHISPNTFSSFRSITSLSISAEVSDFCNWLSYYIETGLQDTNVTYLRFQLQCQGTKMSNIAGLKGLLETPLETLDLSYGSVKDIYGDFYSYLPVSLKYLNLSHNYMKYIDFKALHILENLVILDLSHQKDKCLSANSSTYNFKQVLKQKIDKSCQDNIIRGSNFNNSKTTWEVYGSGFQFKDNSSECYKLPKSLKKLDISNSGLLCFVRKILCNPDNSLQIFIVADQTNVECFNYLVLTNLLKLEYLDLSGNRIKRIPTGAFSNLKNLKQLILSRCALGPIISFEIDTVVLQTLNLSDNSIGYMSENFTDRIENIGKVSKLVVDISKNALLCDCDRIDFVGWMRDSQVIYQRDKITCMSKTDKNYKLGKIAELHESLKYECTVKEVVVGCVILFVMLHLILCIGYLIWYKRWKLRYLLAMGRKNLNPYHPIEDCEVELEYDVYISYERDYDVTRNQTLHELVSQVVYPALQRRGYRVLIREEFEPGVGLYKSISYALRRSKKVVALISHDYCRDYWNVFEFNMAVLEGIYTKRQVLIPVAFEQIGREHLHAEIYEFLRAGSVAYHTANVTDEMFVDYLCDKIRDNREFGD